MLLLLFDCSPKTVQVTESQKPAEGLPSKPQETDVDLLISSAVKSSSWYNKYKPILGELYAVIDLEIPDSERSNFIELKGNRYTWSDSTILFRHEHNFCNNKSSLSLIDTISAYHYYLKSKSTVITKVSERSSEIDGGINASWGPIKFGAKGSTRNSNKTVLTKNEIEKIERTQKSILARNLVSENGKITKQQIMMHEKATQQYFKGTATFNAKIIFLIPETLSMNFTTVKRGFYGEINIKKEPIPYRTIKIDKYLYDYYKSDQSWLRLFYELSPRFYNKFPGKGKKKPYTQNIIGKDFPESDEFQVIADRIKMDKPMYIGNRYYDQKKKLIDLQLWIVPLDVILSDSGQRQWEITFSKIEKIYTEKIMNSSENCN